MLCRHCRKGGASDSRPRRPIPPPRRGGGLAKLQRWAFEALALAPRIPSTCRRSPRPRPTGRCCGHGDLTMPPCLHASSLYLLHPNVTSDSKAQVCDRPAGFRLAP